MTTTTYPLKSLGRQTFRFLSSHGLACLLMLFLFLLTLIGTLEQTRMGLYEVQKKYFSSMFTMHEMPGGILIPLPGVYLLLVILTANLIVGGVWKLKRKWSSAGLYITHAGILFLLLSSMITHHFAIEGRMILDPGETSSVFQSYHEWELAVIDTSGEEANTEYVVKADEFMDAKGDKTETYRAAGLPFDLTIGGFARNAMVRPVQTRHPTVSAPAIDGFYVDPQPLAAQNEQNLPALYLSIEDKQTGQTRQEILWGVSELPLAVEAGGKTWAIFLRRQTWEVPFALTLKKFTREMHPNTNTPRTFESRVVKTEGADVQDIMIRMNEPLRHKGYTFFQSSYIEDPDTGKFTSIFAVVKNPADQFPLIATIIVTFGMVLHFGIKLQDYLKKEREQQAS